MNDAVEASRAAAHDYRSRGWRVIQLHRITNLGFCSCILGANCKSAGKHPRDKVWQNTPPMSGADIEAGWDRWDWNIGLATGEPSGMWVLDIDGDKGGFEAMRALVDKHGPLPETFVVQTGSGGYHYYFTLPNFELRNSQGRIGQGIDTRATGGQVVAPPSVSDKGAYVVIQDAPLAQAPDWLLELARKADVDPATRVTAVDLPKPEDIDPAEWERCNRYAKSVVETEIARLDKLKVTGWDGEPWNATTFQVACSLIEIANSPWNAYTAAHARDDVLSHAPRDPAGFDDYIVTRTFESAVQKVGDGARPVPIDRSAEPDPLFDNPEIQRRPTEGGGEPTGPVVGRQVNEWDFFEGKDLMAAALANHVLGLGPIGWGVDNDFWSYDNGVWSPDHYVVEDRVIRTLGDKFRTGHVANVRPIVRLHAQPITGDPDPERINFTNGMLDWRTGEMAEHDPGFGSTIQLGTHWDPEATCPQFEAFLADVMHEDYVALAWEMIGYLMMSGNPQQVAFLFYGSGGNGKGTLLRLISDLLGRRNIANETLDDLVNNRFRAASLFGRTANIAGDIDATYQASTAMFKRITGEDTLTGEHKNLTPFRFESWAVPMFSVNKFFGSADVTDGYLRRWIVLHFHKKIPENRIVLGLSDLLTSELPGIAYKGVTALRTLMERGHFEPRGEATKAKEEFAEAIDVVRQWVASGMPVQSPEGSSSLVDLYASYSIWSERSGRKVKVVESEFSHRLESLGYPLVKNDGLDYHKGLRVVSIGSRTPSPSSFFDTAD